MAAARRLSHGFNCLAPKPQLSPIDRRLACESEAAYASTVCPESVLPEASESVPLTMTGISVCLSRQMSSTALSAAFALSVSKIVSMMMMSAPPSRSPLMASVYVSTSCWKVTSLAAGLLTSADMDEVRFVGPMEPAMKTSRSESAVSIFRLLSAHSALALAMS